MLVLYFFALVFSIPSISFTSLRVTRMEFVRRSGQPFHHFFPVCMFFVPIRLRLRIMYGFPVSIFFTSPELNFQSSSSSEMVLLCCEKNISFIQLSFPSERARRERRTITKLLFFLPLHVPNRLQWNEFAWVISI